MKKERYFTTDSIDVKARDMLRDVEGLKKHHVLLPASPHCALLVLDMQQYFLEESSHAFVPSAPAIIPRISQLVEACAAKKLPIVFTRHQNTEADAGMMSVWWRDLIRRGTSSWEIASMLDTSQAIVIEKSQYDAFHQTELETLLRDKGIRQVIVCGVMTHLCCETTARSAFVRGFEVFMAIDGTATYSEPLHRATLWNAAHGFAVPMLVEELTGLLAP